MRRLLARHGKPGSELFGQTSGAIRRTDHCPEHMDHIENLGDSALVEGVDIDALSNKRRDNISLQVGEGENEVGPELEDFRDIRRSEGRDTRLFPPRLGRPHAIAGDANDPALLAEQVECFDGLLGQADNAFRWKHSTSLVSEGKPLNRGGGGRAATAL